ncbi:MAG: nitroreductase family protein [Candidatus Thorarchaeota archaeon]
MSGLMEEIVRRRSGRAFKGDPIGHEQLQLILEAGRLAPSCANTQAWDFIVVTGSEVLARAHEALTRGNAWAKTAPVMIVIASREDGGCPAHGLPYFMMDAGLAIENMLLQAVHLGIMGHPTAGWDEDRLRETLNIPESFRIVAVVFFGYPMEPDEMDSKTREKELRPRDRRPLSEIVHWNAW